jgi:ABC-type microcin C transport system permease subunit YejE
VLNFSFCKRNSLYIYIYFFFKSLSKEIISEDYAILVYVNKTWLSFPISISSFTGAMEEELAIPSYRSLIGTVITYQRLDTKKTHT